MTLFYGQIGTFRAIGKGPLWVKAGSVACGSLLCISLGYWLIIKGHEDVYKQRKAEERVLRLTFEAVQRQASAVQAYRTQVHTMEDHWKTMIAQFPTHNEMPGLFDAISKAGVTSGLTFVSFVPLPQVIQDVYTELPITFEVVGRYQQLVLFLSRIAEMNRLVTLHDFVIEGVSPDLASNNDVLDMKMTAKLYRCRPS